MSVEMCTPETVPDIPETALSFRFVRSSGPGGQHVNKVSTAVQLRVLLPRTRLDKPVLERLIRLAGHQVNGRSELIINADRFRSQVRNREDALARLRSLLERAIVKPKIRIATRPSRAQKRLRKDTKIKRSKLKQLREKPREDG
ncbi:MAG: alternative ribosome rescue aminoacyl-tRNA hydrolase ArfB [Gammaproteobacteria bacterium]|nr:alternative ribosome rescue aminoacyl-tRNA hydrolase ArfB [Gammaproteobacteria bacterium]